MQIYMNFIAVHQYWNRLAKALIPVIAHFFEQNVGFGDDNDKMIASKSIKKKPLDMLLFGFQCFSIPFRNRLSR